MCYKAFGIYSTQNKDYSHSLNAKPKYINVVIMFFVKKKKKKKHCVIFFYESVVVRNIDQNFPKFIDQYLLQIK